MIQLQLGWVGVYWVEDQMTQVIIYPTNLVGFQKLSYDNQGMELKYKKSFS